MNVWVVRSPDRSRIRIEVDGHPSVLVYHGWDARQGELDDELYARLCESTDDVEIETIHQELWASLAPTA